MKRPFVRIFNKLKIVPAALVTTLLLASAWSAAQVEIYAATTLGINEEVARVLTEQFNEEHPDIQVTLDAVPWTNIFDRMMVEFASGRPSYDVYWMSLSMLPTFIQSGYLEPLDPYFEDSSLIDAADFDLADIPESLLPRADGNLYHLPYMTGPQIVFYREDLLQEAGLEVPQTLDEFMQVVTELHDPENGIYGTVIHGIRSGAGGNTYDFYPILFSMGGDILNEEGNVVIDSPVAIEALEYWLDLYQHSPADSVNFGAGAASEAMMAGDVAIMYTYGDHYARFLDPERSQIVDSIAWAPFPSGEAGSHAVAHLWGVGMSPFGDQEKKEAAFTYMTYLLSKSSMDTYVDAGGVPPRTSVLQSGDVEAFRLSAEGLETAIGVPLVAEYIELEEILSLALSEVVAGTVTAEEALMNAADEMRSVLGE